MLKEIFVKEIAKLGIKKGRYTLMTWKSESDNGEWLKLSRGVVRLWSLEPIECKNGNTIVKMKTTKNKHQRVKVTYYHWGVEVDESEYYAHNEKKEVVNDWFSKGIKDIVKVGA